MKLLVLDNYDSFTYNLVHIIKHLGVTDLDVIRNGKIPVSEVSQYDKILLSPGPGIPSEAGILQDLIREYADKKPILGVCLGHQAIGEVFGSELSNLDQVYHGIATPIEITSDDYIFNNVPKKLNIGRYHSWVIHEDKVDPSIEVTAVDEEGKVMAIRHKEYDVRGVQFHPESVLTEHGEQMIKNWLEH